MTNWTARIEYNYLDGNHSVCLTIKNDEDILSIFNKRFYSLYPEYKNISKNAVGLITAIKTFNCVGCLNNMAGQEDHIGGCLKDISSSQ